ncbi:MAG: hypothetical protein GSR82_00635 [Desulfurococcales archaeon]|nr:hypothetical protein [Desulfurococcales archaeon]
MRTPPCHGVYSNCFKYFRECSCGKDKLSLLRFLYNELSQTASNMRSRLGPRRFDRLVSYKRFCLFRQPVIQSLGRMIDCFQGNHTPNYLAANCPSHIICDDKRIQEIYRANGYTFKNPDMLIIKGSNVTVLVEEKSYGKQSQSRLQDQLEGSWDNLPEEMHSPCTFMVLYIGSSGKLPYGFSRNKDWGLLEWRALRNRPVIYDIPVFVLERNLLNYSYY